MHRVGYAIVPGFFSQQQCVSLINLFENDDLYRKTVHMERHRFGMGTYRYWDYPLPDIVSIMREKLYPVLVPVANLWMAQLQLETRFPDTYQELQAQCQLAGQQKPTPLILKYGQGGFNTLHQDLYGEVYFPIQVACFLNEPEKDYTGGEFVLTEQIPRAQSRAIVLKPKCGDALFFTTKFRPVQGTKGYYRAHMRHGVSQVLSGHRYTMGVIFHDAVN